MVAHLVRYRSTVLIVRGARDARPTNKTLSAASARLVLADVTKAARRSNVCVFAGVTEVERIRARCSMVFFKLDGRLAMQEGRRAAGNMLLSDAGFLCETGYL